MKRNWFLIALSLCVMSALLLGCAGKNKAQNKGVHIAVFIPGVMSGSPIYEMLAQGVKEAVYEFNVSNMPDAISSASANPSGDEFGAKVTVIEGGFNQAEWENQVTALAASGDYDLIVSSNPSLPAIVSSVSAKFPDQKFLLMDGELAGNPSVYTMRYNQREQAYMAGYIAALTSLEMGGKKSIGLVAGQEYPVMMNTILPGYLEGARAVDQEFTVDFRVVGNWFDALKGADLAADMIRAGSKVLLPIAGGAGEGVVQAAVEGGAKVVWFDTNGYGIRPGTVIGSSILYQDRVAFEKTMLFLYEELPFGTAEVGGMNYSYLDFIEDDPIYIASVSPAIREKQAAMIISLRTGELRLDN